MKRAAIITTAILVALGLAFIAAIGWAFHYAGVIIRDALRSR